MGAYEREHLFSLNRVHCTKMHCPRLCYLEGLHTQRVTQKGQECVHGIQHPVLSLSSGITWLCESHAKWHTRPATSFCANITTSKSPPMYNFLLSETVHGSLLCCWAPAWCLSCSRHASQIFMKIK